MSTFTCTCQYMGYNVHLYDTYNTGALTEIYNFYIMRGPTNRLLGSNAVYLKE